MLKFSYNNCNYYYNNDSNNYLLRSHDVSDAVPNTAWIISFNSHEKPKKLPSNSPEEKSDSWCLSHFLNTGTKHLTPTT